MTITPVAFWLVPAEPALGQLQQVMKRLAAQFDAPRFTPHITLHLAAPLPLDSIDGHLDAFRRQFPPIDAQAVRLSHSAELFQTLCLDFDAAALQACADNLAHHAPGNYRFAPHLALLYKLLASSKRLTLACDAEMTNLLGTIRFDTIVAVVPGAGQNDFAGIEAWDTSRQCTLVH